MGAEGLGASPHPGDLDQAIGVRLLEAWAQVTGDPDAKIAGMVARGVWIGVDRPLPRTPAIFEKKTKWSLPDESDHPWEGE